jgi:excinuclease ABC subunit C
VQRPLKKTTDTGDAAYTARGNTADANALIRKQRDSFFIRDAIYCNTLYTPGMTRDDLKVLQLPDESGVYIFRSGRGKPLYVGKATSLRDRVRSYFASDISEVRSSAIAQMVEEAATLTWEQTDSVLEALILESNLIKKYSPRFNTLEKDNKSFNYLIMTKEAFPHLRVVRGRELFQKYPQGTVLKTFGPYPQGASLKEALKIVRKIFPYADVCKSCVHDKGQTFMSCKPCFNRQLGLCPGVCSGEITRQEYARTIRNISLIFNGKMRTLKTQLEKEMEENVKEEKFEGRRCSSGSLPHSSIFAMCLL